MATYFTLPQGMFFSISNWTVTLELVQGKHFTVLRHRFLWRWGLWCTWWNVLILICMVMNLVLYMHAFCFVLFFYVEPLTFRHYCVVRLSLISTTIAAVAGFLFLSYLCWATLISSVVVSKLLSLCRLLLPSARSLLQHSSTSNTLIHTRFRMTTLMHKQDFGLGWLTHTQLLTQELSS